MGPMEDFRSHSGAEASLLLSLRPWRSLRETFSVRHTGTPIGDPGAETTGKL